MMESLTLDKAMELYKILGSHIPEVEKDNVDALGFIGRIVDNINTSGHHEAYTLSIELMSGKTLQDLQEMIPEEILSLFIDGLMQNRILDLKSFCSRAGF